MNGQPPTILYKEADGTVKKLNLPNGAHYQTISKFWTATVFIIFLMTICSVIASILQYGFGYHIF